MLAIKSSRCWVLFVLFFLLLGAALVLGEGKPRRSGEILRYGVWVSKDGRRAEAMAGTMVAPELGMHSRVLVEGPKGGLVVLDETINARSGLRIYRVSEETSGWWLEVAEDYPESWSSLKDGFNHLREYWPTEARKRREAKFFHAVVTSSGGEIFSGEVFVEAENDGYLSQILSVLEEHQGAAVKINTPPMVLEVAHVLVEGLENEIWNPEHAVLAGSQLPMNLVIEASEASHGSPSRLASGWKIENFKNYIGGILTEPHLIEFASKFSSIDNVDILEGFRVDDLFPEKPGDAEKGTGRN